MSSQLQNKLFHYEVSPPSATWDNIAASLDEDKEFIFPDRLYNYEEQPAPSVWNKINTELDKTTDSQTPVLPFFQRYRIAFKYSSAVAAMVIAAVLVSLLVSKKTVSNDIAGSIKGSSSPSVQKNIPADAAEAPATSPHLPDYTSEIANQPKQLDVASHQRSRKQYAYRALPVYAVHRTSISNRVEEKQPLVKSAFLDRYIVLSKATGDAVKLSKKIYSLFACSENAVDCRQNIETLQQKVAAPTVMACADFTSMLDLLKNMDQNH